MRRWPLVDGSTIVTKILDDIEYDPQDTRLSGRINRLLLDIRYDIVNTSDIMAHLQQLSAGVRELEREHEKEMARRDEVRSAASSSSHEHLNANIIPHRGPVRSCSHQASDCAADDYG